MYWKKFALTVFALAMLAACTGIETPAETQSPSQPPAATATTAPTNTKTPEPSPTASPSPTATPEFIPYEAPDWFENAVLYEIYVRSFADSDGDGIGDFNGITAQADYIESLHVDAVWLMPVHPSPSVHGYDVTDYFAVNPEYGTMEDFRNLVEELHARDIRVIIDFVSSHASNQHPFFKDAYGNPDSPYDDWFRFTNDANTQYDSFDGISTLPRFNHFNPEVKQFFNEAALYWMDLDGDGDMTDGVDGFRVDNATFPPKSYFVDWRQAVKQANPDTLILGEAWVNNANDLGLYFEDEFDALFNFPLFNLLSGSIGLDPDDQFEWTLPPTLLGRRLQDQAAEYPVEGIVVQFATNHDTDRLASMTNGDVQAQKLIAGVTVILPEAFALYYGEEIGMFGVKGGPPHYDSYRREPMDWSTDQEGPGQTTWFNVPDRWNRPDDGVSVEEEDEDPGSLLNTYRKLLALRAELPVFTGGDFVLLDARAVGRKAWAVSRTAGEQTVVGVYNFGNEAVEITIPDFPLAGPEMVDLVNGETYPGSTTGEAYVITLPGSGFVWLVVPAD